jgi:conjugal transfer pilus assembly protein TraW
VAAAALVLISATGSAEDPVNEIVQRSHDLLHSTDAPDGMDGVRLPEDVTPLPDAAFLSGQRLSLGTERIDAPGTAQQRAWNAMLEGAGEGGGVQDTGPPRPTDPSNVLYVYISLGMPARALREMFAEASRDTGLPPTVFLLRGWTPPDIGGLVRELNALLPERERLDELPDVRVDPTLFRSGDISVVPTFMQRDAAGRWVKLLGTTSLADAVEKLATGQYEGKAFGPTYGIQEPDILAVIEERLAGVDWDAQVKRAKERVFARTTGRALPTAAVDDSYLVDLTVQVQRDMVAPSGEVFARAGETINPFDYMSVPQRYAFFDASSRSQRAVARAWREEHPHVTFISTVTVPDPQQREAVLKELGQPVHEINEALIERFQLQAVPALAYQDGRMLRVDVKGVTVQERPQ